MNIPMLTVIVKKIDRLEERFDQNENILNLSFKKAENRLDAITTQVDSLTKRVVDMDECMDTLATKEELSELAQLMSDNFDRQWVVLQRLDQERIFNHERIKRIEETIGI